MAPGRLLETAGLSPSAKSSPTAVATLSNSLYIRESMTTEPGARGREMRRQHAYLGAFDKPILRDWTFWHGLAWAALGVLIAFDTETEPPMSNWLQVPFNVVFLFLIPGWTIALIRRLVRFFKRRITTSRPLTSDRSTYREPFRAVPPSAHPMPSAPDQSLGIGVAPLRPAAPPVQPVPLIITNHQPSQLEIIAQVRTVYPYPIARAARAVHLANDPFEKYQALLDLGESMSLCVGLVSAAWLREFAPTHPALNKLRDVLFQQGLSQGHWHELANSAAGAMQADRATAPRGFLSGIQTKPRNENLISSLRTVVEERNRAAHGGRPHNRGEAAVRVEELMPVVQRALRHGQFLAETPWVLVDSTSYRRQDRRFNVRLRQAMGDHPEFDAQTVVLDQALANDTFYLLSGTEPLDMTPLLVMRYCPQCRQPEVCYADRAHPSRGVSLKTVARGHQVLDPDLLTEFETANWLPQSPPTGRQDG